MFGPGLRTVFTSRWKALTWSLGILATAYCTVPSEDQSGEAEEIASAMLAHVNAAGQASDAATSNDNPWK